MPPLDDQHMKPNPTAKLARESAVFAKAEADIDAGLGIADDDVERWLDALDADPAAPRPSPRA